MQCDCWCINELTASKHCSCTGMFLLQIMRNASDTLIPVTLELGGKDAFIVCEDVDVPHVWILLTSIYQLVVFSGHFLSDCWIFNLIFMDLWKINLCFWVCHCWITGYYIAPYRLHKLLLGLHFNLVGRTVLGLRDFMFIRTFILNLLLK